MRWRSAAGIAAILLPAAGFCTVALLYSQNTLYLNDRWIVGKRMPEMSLLGGEAFLMSRAPLARDQLDLGVYYGHHEIFFRRPLELEELTLEFRTRKDSFLDILYAGNAGRYEGLRAAIDKPWMSFTTDESGKFLRKSTLPIESPEVGWHRVRLRGVPGGLVLNLDGKTHRLEGVPGLGSGRIGFRGGHWGAMLDSIEIRAKDGTRFREDFSNEKGAGRLLALNFAALALLGGFFAWLVPAPRGLRGAVLIPWVVFSLAVSSVVGAWYAFDFFRYSNLIYARNGVIGLVKPGGEKRFPGFEDLRAVVTAYWSGFGGTPFLSHGGLESRGYSLKGISVGPVICPANSDVCTNPDFKKPFPAASASRVVYLGGSQTIGMGAMRLEDTLSVRTHRYLRVKMPASRWVETLNLGVSGWDAVQSVDRFERRFDEIRPRLVVANFGHNDNDPEKLRAAVSRLLELGRTRGFRTMILEEPNEDTPDNPRVSLRQMHGILREVASRAGVPVYGAHDYLLEKAAEGTGELWWDPVHLTSYGYELFAEWLGPKILKELGSR